MNQTNSIKPNKELFKEAIVEANLSKTKIKQELPNLDKDWKDDTIEPVKTATDQEKIDAYDNLETKGLPIKGLPFDWKDKLLRLKYLENRLASFEQNQAELKGWTNAFTEKNPQELVERIKQLGEEKNNLSQELNNWTNTFIDQTAQEVNESLIKLKENNNFLDNETKNHSQELNQWKQTWEGKELSEVKEEWESLNKRPDLPITEQEFFDDYARRKSQAQSKREAEDLNGLDKKLTEYKEKNNKLWKKIAEFVEVEKSRKYAEDKKSVKTIKQAREAIAQLLAETEQAWDDYFKGEKVTDTSLSLELEIYPNREAKVRQVLEWIKEARNTLDYETLLARWCEGNEYSQEYNFDGTLHLLKDYLEFKEFEVPEDN